MSAAEAVKVVSDEFGVNLCPHSTIQKYVKERTELNCLVVMLLHQQS